MPTPMMPEEPDTAYIIMEKKIADERAHNRTSQDITDNIVPNDVSKEQATPTKGRQGAQRQAGRSPAELSAFIKQVKKFPATGPLPFAGEGLGAS